MTNGFDSDASLSSVGALTRDLPPYASSPPIEAVVFAWGEKRERELSKRVERKRMNFDSAFSWTSTLSLSLSPPSSAWPLSPLPPSPSQLPPSTHENRSL